MISSNGDFTRTVRVYSQRKKRNSYGIHQPQLPPPTGRTIAVGHAGKSKVSLNLNTRLAPRTQRIKIIYKYCKNLARFIIHHNGVDCVAHKGYYPDKNCFSISFESHSRREWDLATTEQPYT